MSLMKTPLHTWHASRARMVPFAGFEMPVVYTSGSITAEHLAVRTAAGIFDVSHMGRMYVSGNDAVKFLDLLIPRNISSLSIGKVGYCYVLNEEGGFRDDITVARTNENEFLVTWNAGNLRKIRAWFASLLGIIQAWGSIRTEITDISAGTAMFALQGPMAPDLTQRAFGVYPGSWKVASGKFKGKNVLILGSGYTGEAGCEIVIPNVSNDHPTDAINVWESILELGSSNGVIPCGLGARDTLRMEAGMPLYGNDISEKIPAAQTGLTFSPLVDLEKPFFFGKSALVHDSMNSRLPQRVGVIATARGPSPRAGMKVFDGPTEIGTITSGSFSPLLKNGIGMAYIDRKNDPGSFLTVKGEEKELSIKTTGFPLFDQDVYGSKRKKV